MAKEKCPVCGSQKFYVKDPEDEYEIYEFELNEGMVVFAERYEDCPPLSGDGHIYCNRCIWHGKMNELK